VDTATPGAAIAPLDLDAYLERIRWRGGTRPTFETLTGLLGAHMAHIPFENLDVLLGRPIRLDLPALQDKLVRAHRGGYCFEHATLFAAVLEALGFRPERHAARVTMTVPRTESPRTHMFLVVPLPEGRFVVDPGFGTLAPRVPVPLVEHAVASAGQETHRMVRDGSWWILRAQVGDTVVDAWASTLEPENAVDFALGNHYTSTFPESSFVNRIMMRALTADGRVTVLNRVVTTWRGPEAHSTQLADRAELRAILNRHFGFDLPEVLRLRVPSIPEWE
jgi:N-hydroxyarylamine O-acetyltransferase